MTGRPHREWRSTHDHPELARTGFVTTHLDAVVIDLGCGFDPRPARCGAPDDVDWFSVDLPPIADLRRQFVHVPEHVIGADVTSSSWLDTIPRDRPAIVVSDGLMALLSDEEYRTVIRSVTEHFRAGEVAFLAYSRLAVRNSRRVRISALHVPTRGEGIDDPHEPEAWNAGLVLRRELFKSHAKEIRLFPPLLRAITRLCERSPRIARAGGRVLHYTFNRSTHSLTPATRR